MTEMTRYKRTDFEEEGSETGSVASVNLSVQDGITFQNPGRTYQTYSCPVFGRGFVTPLEKFLCAIVFGLCSLIMVMVVLMALKDHGHLRVFPDQIDDVERSEFHGGIGPVKSKVCMTEECVTISAEILARMNTSIDPCQDFYQYACGGWLEKNPLPPGKAMWGTFFQVQDKNQLILKYALDTPLEEMKSEAERKAKLYFQSCVDADGKRETIGGAPLIAILDELGGWNVTSDSFNAAGWDFQKTIRLIHNKYYLGGLFRWAVGIDDKNSSKFVIELEQGGLTLPNRDYYLNKSIEGDSTLSALLSYMTEVGVLLGGKRDNVRYQMIEVIKFEQRLAEITMPEDQRRDMEKIYQKMPLRVLKKHAPFVDWVKYFNSAFGLVKQNVDLDTQVVAYDLDYLKKLNGILSGMLSKAERLDKGIVLSNYLMWQVASAMTRVLSQDFRQARKVLAKALLGETESEERWRECVGDTDGTMGFATGAMFVRRAFDESAREKAENMIERIRYAFEKSLKEQNWMDSRTMQAAVEKASAITYMIGYPAFITDPLELDKKYADVNISADDYFQNNIVLGQHALKENLKLLNKPVNKTMWSMTPAQDNAYYASAMNQMVIPAGILQPPFYSPAIPHLPLNYGGIGVVIGHELVHGFDDQGREYDKNGNLHQWWETDAIENFKGKAACFETQYDNYGLNGRQTLGENLADNGGLHAAYRALEHWLREHPEEEHAGQLPGLPLSPRQLFFLGFGQVWCSTATAEADKLTRLNDAHSVSEYRVRGPLSNSKEFASAFRCREGHGMNPKAKCSIW
ncbi:unnamed protein product [Notodromas monacha]|uniref:Endothelin-converting enzyme 1 n=1 Tax=Notodromas monacha TaxID=399045 RepID=A0A7R9BEP4_9CRUS|nr:unnamed protein product [Notodromas monacha]CAG0913113.1 unnamed protein product [Notodromas monacha]